MRTGIAAMLLMGLFGGVACADVAPAGCCGGGKSHAAVPMSGATAGIGIALIAAARRRRRERERKD